MDELLLQLREDLRDRYRVDRELGRGGMAIVFLAHDLKHDRPVAVKVLLPELAAALGPERFRREIQIATHLSHPNILPIYDSGAAGGSLFYVMPFVAGESLRQRLDREVLLPIDEAVRIATEVGGALDYAHRQKVIHRDIKPENILLEDGHALVADFGIARALDAVGEQRLTETGLALGTPTYMSPEQATAERKLDGRSDLYSLGCVLYEMLAGEPPFRGPNAQAIIARHTLAEVPSLTIARSSIPDDLEDAVIRSLSKVPADRFASVGEFVEALTAGSVGGATRTQTRRTQARMQAQKAGHRRRWLAGGAIALGLALVAVPLVVWQTRQSALANTSAAGGLDPRRIAVLYFDDLSPGEELAYLADGLTEDLILQLDQVQGLDVISRSGVAPFRDPGGRDSVPRVLGAGTLIAGSVEPVGADRIRISGRLIDGRSGVDFERASFVFERGDPLAMRDSASDMLSRLLRQRLGEEVQVRERRLRTGSPDAWTLVLQAERLRKDAQDLALEDPAAALGALERADSLLARAAAADPKWAEPHVVRAWIGFDAAQLAETNATERLEWAERGLDHASRAAELSPDEPAVLEARGTLRYAATMFSLDPDPARANRGLDQAQGDLEAAVRAQPTLARAQAMLSFLHHARKDIVSSVLAARRAYEADAYLRNAAVILNRLFEGSYNLSQFVEARRWCDEGARRFPSDYSFTSCQLWLLATPDARPDADEAWRLSARLDSLAPGHGGEMIRRVGRMVVGGVLARASLEDSARRVLLAARAGHDVDPHGELVGYEAVMRVMLGEPDTAVVLLKRYVAANPGHSFQVGGNVHWWWQRVRNHPGFAELLALEH